MNSILRLEELAMFGLFLFGFTLLEMSWWWYAGFILLPDAGMVG